MKRKFWQFLRAKTEILAAFLLVFVLGLISECSEVSQQN